MRCAAHFFFFDRMLILVIRCFIVYEDLHCEYSSLTGSASIH